MKILKMPFVILYLVLTQNALAQVGPAGNLNVQPSHDLANIIIQLPRTNETALPRTYGGFTDPKIFLEDLASQRPNEILSITEIVKNRTFSTTINRKKTTLDTINKLSDEGAIIKKNDTYWPALTEAPELIGLDHFSISPQSTIDFGNAGTKLAIAILDTGFQADHAFLNGNIIKEACFSSVDPLQGIESLCPGGTVLAGGVAFDVSQGAAAACSDKIKNCDHGTHVAGIVTGNAVTDPRDPTKEIKGVASSISIYAIQVFSKFTRDKDCKPFTAPCVKARDSSIIQAIKFVIEQNIKHNRGEAVPSIAAVSLSLGKGKHNSNCDVSNALASEIRYLRKSGVATFISAGNEGYRGVAAPACISDAFSISALTKSNKVWSKSNRHNGGLVDIFAPGVGIYSSVTGGKFNSKSGTSMATPMAAAAYMLLKSKYPDRTIADIEAALKQTGKNVVDTRTKTVFPVLNISKSDELLATGLPIDIAVNVIASVSNEDEIGDQFLLAIPPEYDAVNIQKFLQSQTNQIQSNTGTDLINIYQLNEKFIRLSSNAPISRQLLEREVNQLVPDLKKVFVEQSYIPNTSIR